VATKEAVWVGVWRGERNAHVFRIDPHTNRVVARVPVRGLPGKMAAGGGSLWVTADVNHGAAILQRIDPGTNRVAATVRLPTDRLGPVAAGRGAVWVVLMGGESWARAIARIDPKTTEVTRITPLERGLPRHSFDEVTVARGAVWVLALEGLDRPGDLIRIDPRSARVTARVRARALNSGGGPGGVWITGCVDCRGYRSNFFAQAVDTEAYAPLGARIAFRHTSASPLFVGLDGVWFYGNQPSGTVAFRLDHETHAIEKFLRVGNFVASAAAFDPWHRAIWIGRVAPAAVVRVALDGRS
jgi:acyl-coenzyme A thioesterase PaaI-like protein